MAKYTLKLKINAITMKKNKASCDDILKKLEIKNISQIYDWLKKYDIDENGELENLITKKKTKPKELEKLMQELVLEIIPTFKYRHQRRKFYLKLIEKYYQKISLNSILKILKIHKSTYYRWLTQEDNVGANQKLQQAISDICHKYAFMSNNIPIMRLGYKRVWIKMKKLGHKITRRKVLEIMQELNLLSRTQRIKPRHIKQKQTARAYLLQNKLNNNFTAINKHQKFCTDITYIPIKNGRTIYLSAIMDFHNREIIAWNIGIVQDVNFVLDTLNQLPDFLFGAIIHSDQGTVYTSKEYMQAVKAKGMISSFSKKGTPSNNACIESFWSNFKRETLYLIKYKDLQLSQVKEIITQYINFYNYHREMKVLDNLTPVEYKIYYQNNPELVPVYVKTKIKKRRRYAG